MIVSKRIYFRTWSFDNKLVRLQRHRLYRQSFLFNLSLSSSFLRPFHADLAVAVVAAAAVISARAALAVVGLHLGGGGGRGGGASARHLGLLFWLGFADGRSAD